MKLLKIGNIYSDAFTGMSYAGNVWHTGGVSPILQTAQGGGRQPHIIVNEENKSMTYKIRKLTPKECFRLMGFSDEAHAKAEAVNSNTQLYKQAGNSIVVPVLEAIFGNLYVKS